MKKLFTLLYITIILCGVANIAIAQCPTCPSSFTVSDSIRCNFKDLIKNPAVTGIAAYTNPFQTVTACKNSRVKYALTATQGSCFPGISYSLISITGGVLINFTANQFTVQWGTGNFGNVIIAFTIPGNGGSVPPCNDTINIKYSLTTSPLAAFTSSPQPACFNNPTNISFNSAGTLNATNYFWNFGDGFTSTAANPTHAYAAPGTYNVTLIVGNTPPGFNGSVGCPTCVDSVSHQVIISNLPGPPIDCIASVCAAATKKYCTSASGCSSYIWTVTGGTIVVGQNTNCVTVLWGTGIPQGTLNLVVAGCVGVYCPQGTTVTIPIIPASGAIILGSNPVCINTSATYTLPSWPGTTYSWALASGGIISPYNTNTNQININWISNGDHILTCNYYDSALNCGGTATLTIKVRNALSITGPSTVCQNTTTTLVAKQPVNVNVACTWTIPPPNTFSGNGTPFANITWPVAGTYNIIATAVIPNTVCAPANYIVTVVPQPVISNITGADSICIGKVYVYAAVSNAVGLFNWSTVNATSISYLGVNNDSIQLTWVAGATHSLTVTQTAIPSGCVSNSFTKNVFPWPTPSYYGTSFTFVCADQIVTYVITNILNANLQWSVYPPSFGTVISGQGTNTVQIKWHGTGGVPNSINTVHLYYGVCNADSVAIYIHEPPIASITASGSLCSPTGITLNTGAVGNFIWTCVEHPIVPTPGNTPSINVNLPGHYNVQIQNYNGSGCTVTASYFIPNVGFPVANISATNVLDYCLPSLPNMNLVAANAPGYSFQWFLVGTGLVGTGVTLPINTLTSAGSYTYYCIVSLGTCSVTSLPITINIANCPPPVGCSAEINVNSITGCNPFVIGFVATSPSGAVISGSGNPSILHLDDGDFVNSATTHTYTSVGYKPIRICADVQLPAGGGICRVCKDTVVNVVAAANFTSNIACKKIFLYDASTTVSPVTIVAYNWTVGYNPGNTPVPLIIASFNNISIANPIISFTQSGSYIVSETIRTSTNCFITHRDTFNVIVPNANFNVTNSCVGTIVNFNNLVPAPTNFWNFGDAATSYTSPTFHAYSTANTYNITHIVTDVNGCKDTIIKPIVIIPAPTCTITYLTPLTFCNKDSVILKGCVGYSNYQWYNNGVAILGATNVNDTVKQTGNYHFTALSGSGCIVRSDTVSVNVLQGPNVSIYTTGSTCANSSFSASVPPCVGCTYQWLIDGNPAGNASGISGTSGFGLLTIGTHTIFVSVTNSLGCTDTSSINKTFYALPTISIAVTGPAPFCSNNLYVLTASSNAASPSWAWTANNINIVLSSTNILNASAAGNYTIAVTDAITGCLATAIKIILPSPELNLFPIGCDTLCDTSHLFLPLASFNGNLAGYNIDWYDNAPAPPTPFGPPVGNGVSFPLNLLPLGAHNISVIVTSPNGCVDTSNVYSIIIKHCPLTVLAIKEINLTARQVGNYGYVNWTTNQEIDNDYFIVERSTDGIYFEFAGKVWSKGNSNELQYYTLNDLLKSFNTGIYYRVKAVAFNGREFFSNIAKINPTKAFEETMIALPNVTSDKVSLLINCNSFAKTTLVIYAADGRLMKKVNITLNKGITKLDYSFSEFPSGIYLAAISTDDKQLTATIIKQ